VGKTTADDHYEEKFEFPLWKMIQKRAEEKDLSYIDAAWEVLPEFGKDIRFRDDAFEDECIENRKKELAEQEKVCQVLGYGESAAKDLNMRNTYPTLQKKKI
jgi:hypothetical protein